MLYNCNGDTTESNAGIRLSSAVLQAAQAARTTAEAWCHELRTIGEREGREAAAYIQHLQQRLAAAEAQMASQGAILQAACWQAATAATPTASICCLVSLAFYAHAIT